jgi:uncharacterized membrane protein HdeD (DUF308 family)
MQAQLYKYNKSADIYFYFGFGGITIFLGILFLLAPLLFPLALVVFGAFLIITGIASLIEGVIVRFR